MGAGNKNIRRYSTYVQKHKKLVVSTLCSVALASLFTTQVKAYDETHEVGNVNRVYYNEIANSLSEYTLYLEEEIFEKEVELFAEDADDAEEASNSEETSDTEEVDAQQDSESLHVESEIADVFDSDIRETTTDEVEIIEVFHADEEEELLDETGDELIEEVDEVTFWTLEELLHEIAQLEQIQVRLQDDESSDTMEEEVPLTDEEIQAILDGTPTTLEELELYFYTKLGNDPFLMEYFYKNLETDKMLSTYFKGVEAFDLPEGYFTRTDDENRKLRAYFYQVLQVDPYFREYFYRSEENSKGLEDKEMEEGAAFFKRGSRRTTYRPTPKVVYRPRPHPVYRPVNRPKQVARPVVKPTPKPNVKPASKPILRPATRPVIYPNITPIPPKSIPPKPNPPMQAPRTSSALEAADLKLPSRPTRAISLKELGILVGEFTGYNDGVRLLTGRDPITGKKANQSEAVGSLALNFIPGGLGKVGKALDVMNDLKKGAKVLNAVDKVGDATRVANAVDKLNDSSKVANAVDKLNDSSKVANAVDKATDTGKAVVKSADSAGDVSRGTKGSGRASNKIKPDPNATGDHTVFKQNKETGAITNYRTYETNPHNPTGFQEVKGFDGIGRSHTNSLTSLKVETPHITSKTIPGGVRAASTWEIPTSLQNIIP